MTSKALILTLILASTMVIHGQSTAFTYQGSLTTTGSPASGNHDFEFRIYDASVGGTQIGSTLTRTGVPVTNGIFSVELNFGGLFTGGPRYLEIAVKTAGAPSFTLLAPRHTFTSSPYAIKSLAANVADLATNANQLGGVVAAQYVVTTDPRMTDPRTPTAGSGSYIQNQPAVQQIGSFNINGTGKAEVIDAARFDMLGFRVLSTLGTNNLFAGIFAGTSNTTGTDNTFVGREAGEQNTTGFRNTFVGGFAGESNTTGRLNTYVGDLAGRANQTGFENSFFGVAAGQTTTGSQNSFFGTFAGQNNTTGQGNVFAGIYAGEGNTVGNHSTAVGAFAGRAATTAGSNSFFGYSAGSSTTGAENAFFGYNAGRENQTGVQNSFFGLESGIGTTTGSRNVFLGHEAGSGNVTGSSNTAVGNAATLGASNLTFATALGAGATVATSNTVVLGRAADTVLVPGTITSAVINATTEYRVNGQSALRMPGANNLFVGLNAGANLAAQNDNTFVGTSAGGTTVSSHSNTFMGSAAGFNNTSGVSNSFFGRQSGLNNTTGDSNIAVGSGAGRANITGFRNTFLGTDANAASGDLSWATAIGANSIVSTSNSIVLGRPGGEDTVRIPGNLNLASGGLAIFNSPIVLSSSGLGSTGGTPLCRNASAQIALCSASAVDDVMKEQQAEINDLRAQVEALKKLVCAASPKGEICKE
jgi:hypothetical protein